MNLNMNEQKVKKKHADHMNRKVVATMTTKYVWAINEFSEKKKSHI